jgi:hypothetical protein
LEVRPVSIADEISTAVGKAVGKVARVAVRGIVKAAQANGLIQVQAHTGDSFDSVELWQQAGFSSRPTAGTEAIVIKIGASGDHPVVIATTLRSARPSDLALGDASMHAIASSNQAEVRCKADGEVDLLAPGAGKFVNVGGNDEKLLLGETFGTDFDIFIDALIAATTVPHVAAAATTLLAAMGANGANWLAAKGKVT